MDSYYLYCSDVFVKKSVVLGYINMNNNIHPSEEKIEAVNKFPEPINGKKLQSFLGLTGYFRKFIKDYAVMAKPLSNWLRKVWIFSTILKSDSRFNN